MPATLMCVVCSGQLNDLGGPQGKKIKSSHGASILKLTYVGDCTFRLIVFYWNTSIGATFTQ